MMTTITLTQEQAVAVESMKKWFADKKQPSFVLVGYAGTGKSTIVEHAISELGVKKEAVMYGCYTGKAALVLSQKTGENVFTLHKICYKPKRDPQTGKIHFVKRPAKDYKDVELFVVDECSMVTPELMADLMSFNTPVLFIGDHGQLPPILKKDEVSPLYERMANNPDARLTEIHRQAADSPIISLATDARHNVKLNPGWYGNKEVLIGYKNSWADTARINAYKRCDIIITGKNDTRAKINTEYRQVIKGFQSPYPQEGDKLICTRNQWSIMSSETSLVNGLVGTITKVNKRFSVTDKNGKKHNGTDFDFLPDGLTEEFHSLRVLDIYFEGKTQYEINGIMFNILPRDKSDLSEFDYGYAITCHKSQGSQWDKVLVYDESHCFRENSAKWLYTAITRAADRLMIIK